MGDATYYVRSRGRVAGPHDLPSLRRLIRRGVVARHDEVSSDGHNWQPADECPGLFGADAAAFIGAPPQPAAADAPTPEGAAAADAYYYAQDGQSYGPVPGKLLVRLAGSGGIGAADLVWREGELPTPASEVPILTGVVSEAPSADDLRAAAEAPRGGRRGRPGSRSTVVVLVTTCIATGVLALTTLLLWAAAQPTESGTASVSTLAGPPFGSSSGADRAEPQPSTPPAETVPPTSAPATTQSIRALTVPATSPPRKLRDLSDEAAVGEAVGFVVVGLRGRLDSDATSEVALASGSCFVVSPNGDMITNRHVVEPYVQLTTNPELRRILREEGRGRVEPMLWVFFGGRKFVARVLHVSPTHDLAIMHAERNGGPYFRIARTASAHRGNEAVALGFPGVASTPLSPAEVQESLRKEGSASPDVTSRFKPRDFEYTQTSGSVSRTVKESDGHCWIQHEAVIRPGNSGGPLVLRSSGLVIGINTLLLQGEKGVAQANMATEISQLRGEIDAHVRGVAWE